jgi:hypothetical protein
VALINVNILPHHYTASQTKDLDLKPILVQRYKFFKEKEMKIFLFGVHIFFKHASFDFHIFLVVVIHYRHEPNAANLMST